MTATPWLMLALLGSIDPAGGEEVNPPAVAREAARAGVGDAETNDDDDDDDDQPGAGRVFRDESAALTPIVLLPVVELGVGGDVTASAAQALTAVLRERAVIIDLARVTGAQRDDLASCSKAACQATLAELGAVAVVSASVGALEDELVVTLRVRSATSSDRVQRRGPREQLRRLAKEAAAQLPLPVPPPRAASPAERQDVTPSTPTLGTGVGGAAVDDPSDDPPDAKPAKAAPAPTAPERNEAPKPTKAKAPPKPGDADDDRASPSAPTPRRREASSTAQRPPELMLLVYYGLGLVPIVGSPFVLPMAQGLAASVLGPQIVGVDYPDWGVPVAAGYLTYVLGYGVGIVLYVAGATLMFSGSIAPVLMLLGGGALIIGATIFEPVIFHVVASQQAVPVEEAP
jgi:hypothetical protein